MQSRSDLNLKGIDVSHWQGKIDWRKVKEDGVQFVFIKATEGYSFLDPNLRANYEGATEQGLQVGFYAFGHPDNEPEREVEWFLSNVQQLHKTLPYVLDLENAKNLSKHEISSYARSWLRLMEVQTGEKPMLYTYTHFAKNYLEKELSSWPLWIAQYDVQTPGSNGVWEEWDVFQYTSKGKVNGIDGFVDLNEMSPAAFQQNAEQSTSIYTIKKGDTLWELEKKYRLKFGTLQKLNPAINPLTLQIGQQINFPQTAAVSEYIVQKGDVLSRIAKAHQTTTEHLLMLNPTIKNKNVIYPGQKIRLK